MKSRLQSCFFITRAIEASIVSGENMYRVGHIQIAINIPGIAALKLSYLKPRNAPVAIVNRITIHTNPTGSINHQST